MICLEWVWLGLFFFRSGFFMDQTQRHKSGIMTECRENAGKCLENIALPALQKTVGIENGEDYLEFSVSISLEILHDKSSKKTEKSGAKFTTTI